MIEPGSYVALLWVVVCVLSGSFTTVVIYLKNKIDNNDKKCESERDFNKKATLAFARVMLAFSNKIGYTVDKEDLVEMGIESDTHPIRRDG